MKYSNLLYSTFLGAILCFTFFMTTPKQAQASELDQCNGLLCTQVNCAFYGLLCDGVCSVEDPVGDCEYTSPYGDCMNTGCLYPQI